MKLLVIGNGAAGATAAFEARKYDEDIDITIITCDKYTHYSPCGLPYAIAGKYKVKDLIVYPLSLYKMSDIDLCLNTKVTEISPDEKIAHTADRKFTYNKLIITTGSKPFLPDIKNVDKAYALSDIGDGERICNAIKNIKKVVVIGAGLIGLETAASFKEYGLDVKVVEVIDRVLPRLLDDDIAHELKTYLEQKGIEFLLGKKAHEIVCSENGDVKGIKIDNEIVDCDFVLVASGMKPNTSLAEDAGMELGHLGGIKVNEKMETSIKDIYAAGDCAESIHYITKSSVHSMLGSTAVREGKVAGVNAAGGDLRMRGVLNTTITKLADMKVGFVGLNTEQAEKNGIDVISTTYEGISRDTFFPGGERLVLKLLGDRKTGKIIGAQLLGKEGVFARLLAISFAMQRDSRIEDMAFKETAYVPPVSPTFDPITLAAEMLMRRIDDQKFIL